MIIDIENTLGHKTKLYIINGSHSSILRSCDILLKICNLAQISYISGQEDLACNNSAITKHCHPGTGRCYWMSTAPKANWTTARTNCKSQGGDLAVMETEELWDFVTGNVRLVVTFVKYVVIWNLLWQFFFLLFQPVV